jgi:hypothetical protein
MRAIGKLGATALLLLTGCGAEIFFGNIGHEDFLRPASVIRGKTIFPGQIRLQVTDADGNAIAPFETHFDRKTGEFEMRLPSATYSMLYVSGRVGNMSLRTIVPAVGEESDDTLADVNARNTTESVITEARLSADGAKLKAVTPAAYLATRKLIQAAMDRPGPTKDLLDMVTRMIEQGGDPASGSDPVFFDHPLLDDQFAVKTSPLSKGWLQRTFFDYDGDGSPNSDTSVFDAKLSEVAQLFRPAGCPDPDRIRVVFAVNFNEGQSNGNCGSINRFKWATDKPNKQMFIVGWLHKDSPVQDASVNAVLGAGVPNQLVMYDDGTNGDETAGDGIWTRFFDVPRGARIGYKYTWGFRGSVWTGTEEWPGNSHIVEATDVDADDIVYRYDNFGDEATNKDNSNLNLNGHGSIDWTTDLGHGVGAAGDKIPEARENPPVQGVNDCTLAGRPDLTAVGPLTVLCTQ